MDLGESLAKRIVSHFKSSNVGEKARLEGYNPPLMHILGFDFTLNLSGRKLDVLIVPVLANQEGFSQYFDEISIGDTFNKPEFENIREGMNKSQYYLKRRRFYKNGEGGYHFRCEIANRTEDKIVLGLLNHVIRPVLMYQRIKK